MTQVTRDVRAQEQGVDPRRLIEAFVVQEAQVRRELHVDHLAQYAAQELRVPVQRLDGRLDGDVRGFQSSAQRFDEHRGVAQVGRDAHLGHGDRNAVERLVVNLFLTQDFHQGMAHQFAGAQLALRGAGLGVAAAAMSFVFEGRSFHPADIGDLADFSRQKAGAAINLPQNDKYEEAQVTTQTPAAVAYQPRIDMIDALRGFALMGLFLVHAVEYYELYWLHPPADNPIHNWVFGLFAGKSFAMFALMFGLSFFIIMDRQAKRGVDFTGRFLWRLTVLFIIGFFHALFYGGEVLQVLALCGVALVPLNKLSWKWLLPLAVLFFAEPVVSWQLWHAQHDIAGNTKLAAWSYPALDVYAHGSLFDVLRVNLYPSNKWDFMWEYGRIAQILGLFLTGLMLGRAGFFTEPEKFTAARRVAFVIALAVALSLHFAKPWIVAAIPGDKVHFLVADRRDALLDNWQSLAAMFMWVCGFIELYQHKVFRLVQRLLAPAGRMTLTLYVGQSLICTPLYYGYGLGWYGTIGQERALVFGIAFFVVQLIFAHLWFRVFLYGPLEWLWRAATYTTLKVPFVRKARAEAAA